MSKKAETGDLKIVTLERSGGARKKKQAVGSSRGIESMFRNAYRAQLDLMALGATKANIMISLNGFLLSMLLLGGAWLLDSAPLLMLPIGAFLLTCTVSIVFAVLAARPQTDRTVRELKDFRTDDADLLLFRQFAKLPKHDFMSEMGELMRNKERIYRNMTAQIYDMGLTADRMFARLYLSYSTFMIGLLISVSLLIVVMIRHALLSS